MTEVGGLSFVGYSCRDATVISNRIMYFGSYNNNATFVLRREEESNKLEVERKFPGIEYRRGGSNSSFCTH